MDLSEIAEFIKDESESYDNRNVDEQYHSISHKVDFSPQYRLRAYTWHGDRPSLHGNLHRTAAANANDATIIEDSAENESIEKFEKASDEQTAVSTGTRKNFTRRNAWGNWSYADIITKAINSTPNKRMTLSEIYNWMMQNIPFFKEKGETNSSAGWKNSIRHNLSLHSCFMKVQNESTGKSSWWMLNPDYKSSKLPRRRAATMDVSKLSALQSQRKMKKMESMDNFVDVSKNNRSEETLLNSFSSVPNDNFNDCIDAMDDFINSLTRSNARVYHQNVKLETFDDSDEKHLPPAPASSLSSSFTDQPFQWPQSQISDHNFSLNDFCKGREAEDFFNLAPTDIMESDPCSVGIPINNTKMTVIKTENAAYSNSLPMLSNINNLIFGTNFFNNNGNGKETDNETFLVNNDQLFNNSINDIKSNESYLLSGGRLVRSSGLKPQNNLNNYNYQSEHLLEDSDQSISNKNPLLSEYLSLNDSAVNNDFDLCQSQCSGILLNSKNSVDMAVPVRPVSWQEQEQFKSNHGLLLQLLTEKSQNNSQRQFVENSGNKLILPRLLCDDNRKHNCALHQQSDNFNVNPHHHHQNQLPPQNSSMLRHLLTAGQKCQRSSNVNNPHHLHRSIPSAHRTSNQPFNRLPFPVVKLPENNADSRYQHSHLVSSQLNTAEMFPVQKTSQQLTPNTTPFVNNVNNFSQQEITVNSNINVLSANGDIQHLGLTTASEIPKASEILLPSDLDLSLLDLDIECNIDQVIDHEKKFGDGLDFSFDDDFMLIDGAF